MRPGALSPEVAPGNPTSTCCAASRLQRWGKYRVRRFGWYDELGCHSDGGLVRLSVRGRSPRVSHRQFDLARRGPTRPSHSSFLASRCWHKSASRANCRTGDLREYPGSAIKSHSRQAASMGTRLSSLSPGRCARPSPHDFLYGLSLAFIRTEVGVCRAFEPVLERASIRVGRRRPTPHATYAQSALANPCYRRAPSLGTVTLQ